MTVSNSVLSTPDTVTRRQGTGNDAPSNSAARVPSMACPLPRINGRIESAAKIRATGRRRVIITVACTSSIMQVTRHFDLHVNPVQKLLIRIAPEVTVGSTWIRFMDTPLKLGIIGGGLNSAIGRTHHIAAQLDQCWRIESGCFSQKKDVNNATADSLRLPRDGRFDKWQDLLTNSRIDAVAVLTPTPTHAEIIEAALARGIPTISEKSLATNSGEIASIRRIEKETGGFLAVTFNYSGYPMVRELREWIRSGWLGQLLHVDAQMPQESYIRCISTSGNRPVPQGWRMRDYGIPTVSLDLGVHLHHLVDFLTGHKPTRVCGVQRSGGFFPDVIDSVECLAEYSGGLNVRLLFGKCFLGHANGLRIRVSGTEGAAEWYQMQPEELILSDKFGTHQRITRAACDLAVCNSDRYNRFKAGHPAGYIEAFANCYADLAQAVTARLRGEDQSLGKEFVADSEVAHEGLLLLEAICESATSGIWVAPKPIDVDSLTTEESIEPASPEVFSREAVQCGIV